MKLTKETLKKIIEEEVQLVREMNHDGSSSGSPVVDIITRMLHDAGLNLDHQVARDLAENIRYNLANAGLLKDIYPGNGLRR